MSKKRSMRVFFCSAINVFLLILLGSCSPPGGDVRLRARMEQAYGSTLEVELYAENSEGMALNAANVILEDPSGTVSLMPFMSATASYRKSFNAGTSGTYSFSLRSEALAADAVLDIPFTALANRPSISGISDSAGASALAGQGLSAGNAISITWTAVEGATTYLVQLTGMAGILYSATTADPYCLIPANNLAAGAYSLMIEAQAIGGDPLLRDSPFYSLCVSDSPSFSFHVIE